MAVIRCYCGFKIYDGLILKIRVGQFSQGYCNLKCKRCGIWVNGISIKYLTGEIKEDYILKKKEVYYEAINS